MKEYITAHDVEDRRNHFYTDKFLPLCIITRDVLSDMFLNPVIERAKKLLEGGNKNEG